MSFSIAAIFAAGLLTFASPCVLPLMPIYLATLAGGSLEGAHPRRTLLLASAFALGLATVFVLLGALASSLGGLLVAHRTQITLVSGAVMILFGMRALGVLRIAALDRDARPGLERVRSASSVAGAFLFGGAFALGWSPCIGPVLASVLTYAAANAGSPWRGAGYLAVYAAGLALPLLILAAATAHASRWLRRFRAAIPKLEQLTGAVLTGVGLWTLFQLLSVAAPETELASSAIPSGTALLSIESDGGCEIEGQGHVCALPDAISATVHGEPTVNTAVDGARMLEFTSQECPVCRRMQPVLDRLLAACTELRPHVERVDVTTARGRALADTHHVRGTPTFLMLDDAGIEQARLLGENSSEDLAAALERALGVSCWS